LALVGLRKQLDRFDSAVLGLPLARGAAGEPVPAPFLRLSMDLADAEGDVSGLPQVNRVAVPNAELGGQRSQAGFTVLENEADAGDGRQHLLARWSDRILFALPLATEIASLGIDPEEIRVICGAEIRLGTGGPVIPIDEFGRTPLATDVVAADILATKIISEDNPVPPAADPLILRDVRAEIPEAERAWSGRLAGLVQALRAAPRYEKSMLLQRPEPITELALISLLALFGTWATALRGRFWRVAVSLLVAAFGAELVWLLAGQRDLWLPPIAALAPSLTDLMLGLMPERKKALAPAVAPSLVAPVQPASLPVAEPVFESPAEAVAETPAEPVIETPSPAEAPPATPPGKPAAKAPAKKAVKKAARKPPKKKGR
jgi:hypothetical protein